MASDESLYASVQDHYKRAAKGSDTNYGHVVASAFGYSKEELTNAPLESNLGLSCGNPLVMAKIREGETVVDLGSGAGFDVFQAAKKVGASGRVIGVDMNEVSKNLGRSCCFIRARAEIISRRCFRGQRPSKRTSRLTTPSFSNRLLLKSISPMQRQIVLSVTA